jgi:oxygen-dependent protoporphyrinogen oxidase
MVIIVGAGITGLAAAHELSIRGVPFQLLEASDRPGGIIFTDHVGGFTIEAGPDAVLAQKPAALELCDELGLTPRLLTTRRPRTAYVLKRGRLHPLPARSTLGIPTRFWDLATYDLLPVRARVRLALESFIPPKPLEDESVGAFFRRRFGQATVGLVAEPLLGGIHAGDIEALSVRSLFPRFVEAEARRGSVIRSLRRTRRTPAADGLFRSLSGGMGELVSAVVRRLPSGSLRLNAPATALARSGEDWTVTAPGLTSRARAVILAVPSHAAAKLLESVDEPAAALCRAVPYVSTASVALAWPRDAIRHALAGSGFVVARRFNPLRITACTWVSSKWEGRAPAGSALLRVFIGGAHDPAAVDLADREISDIAARELGGVLGIDGPPSLARVYRWRAAGAQHNVGQLARMARLEARLLLHPGLLVAGSGFRSIGIPDCIADGRAAAIAAAKYVGGNERAQNSELRT